MSDNQKARELLENIEWNAQDIRLRLPVCPVCFHTKERGHADSCELNQALAALQAQPCKIELLKDYIAVNDGNMSQIVFREKHGINRKDFDKIAYAISDPTRQAQPICKTCGGSGRKEVKPKPTIEQLEKFQSDGIKLEIMPDGRALIPCPDCPAQSCATCKGTGKRKVPMFPYDKPNHYKIIDCPDCPPALAGELSKNLKKLEIDCMLSGEYRMWVQQAQEACDHLDQQAKTIEAQGQRIEELEAEIKALKGGSPD